MEIISDGKSLIINRGKAIECLRKAVVNVKIEIISDGKLLIINRGKAIECLQFLKNYFTAFMEGRTDFENLTLAILGKIN